MKKYVLLLVFFSLYFYAAFSQESNIEIKDGTHLEYLYDLHGQKRVIKFDLMMELDTLKIEWNLSGLRGTYALSSLALNRGNKLYNKQAVPFQTILLNEDETVCLISRSAYQNLIKTNQFIYDETTYMLDTLQANYNSFLELNNKKLPVLHVKTRVDETEMWILKNPDFPLICKLDLNPLGINYSLIVFEN
ncbi:MAG: hypothetical protein AB7D05_02275 [Mangrovibacterium sp.]